MRKRVILQVVLIAVAFGAAMAAWLPFTSLAMATEDRPHARAAPAARDAAVRLDLPPDGPTIRALASVPKWRNWQTR